MALDLSLLKEHPYATGGVVIVGGIVVFYLLSSSGSSGSSSSSGSSNYGQALAADTQLAQVQAATAVQTSAQQAQLQQTALQAQVANTQTAASLQAQDLNTYAGLIASLYGTQQATAVDASNNAAQTTQQANQLLYAQNIQSLQDAVLTDQINQAANISANNNATSLAGLVDQLNYNTGVTQLQAGLTSQANNLQYNLASQGLSDTAAAQSAQQNEENTILNWITNNAGISSSSGEYGIEQSLIAATTGSSAPVSITQSQTAGAASIAASNNALLGNLTKTASSALAGLFG